MNLGDSVLNLRNGEVVGSNPVTVTGTAEMP
jgi:hypothetical protein